MDLIKTIDNREFKMEISFDKITRNNQTSTVLVRPGQIEYFAMRNPPKGWFECNGDSFDPNIYVDLSNAIGSRWGTDNENYKLPDFRGCFIRSWSNTSSDNDVGRELNSFQEQTIKSHKHSFSVSNEEHSHSVTQTYYSGHNHSLLHTGWSNGSGQNRNHFYPGTYRGLAQWQYRYVGYTQFHSGGHVHGTGQYGDITSSTDGPNVTLLNSINSVDNAPNNFSILICIKY